jgi:hypothetical protein
VIIFAETAMSKEKRGTVEVVPSSPGLAEIMSL